MWNILEQPEQGNFGSILPENPLCNISPMHKMKVCILLLNTPYYTNKYILAPVLANIDQQCKRVTLKDGDALDANDKFAFPCWVKPVSNPWIKIINLPNTPTVPLYITVNYRSFEVNTFKTVLQGTTSDVVQFDANLRDLFVKDLFFIFQDLAERVKQIHRSVTAKRKDAADSGYSNHMDDSDTMLTETTVDAEDNHNDMNTDSTESTARSAAVVDTMHIDSTSSS